MSSSRKSALPSDFSTARCDGGVGHLGPQHLPHQPRPRLAAQPVQGHLLQTPRPQAREERLHLGPGQRQHHEGVLAQLPQRLVHQRHGERITPVQVLQHQQHRVVGTLGLQEGHQRPAHLRAHQPGIAPGRVQPGTALLREGDGAQLAQELHGLPGPGLRQVPGDAPGQPLPLLLRRLALPDAAQPPQRLAQQAVRRARAHRVPSPHQHQRRCSLRSRRRRNSWRSRDLPMPAGAVTSSARGPGSSTQEVKVKSSSASSCSRPTQGVGLPSSGRDSSAPSFSPCSRKVPE